MNKHKIIFAVVFSLSIFFGAAAFDWPIKDFDSANLTPSFAQNRKQHFNTSIIFTNASEALATEKGTITIAITEHQEDGDWFESTLGNCIVIAHEDNLVSVYGNLKKSDVENCAKKNVVFSGEELGAISESAWSETPASFEFQIADNEGKTFLNPLILMPRLASVPRLYLENLSIENKFGRSYELSGLRTIQAGMYSVFKTRRENSLFHTSSVFVNGSELENISKDTLRQKDGLMAISGQGQYQSNEFYPDETRELLGHILIPHGNNTIAVTISDILENERTVTFNIQGY